MEQILDAEGRLTMLPALIDPHVHFRVPGAEYKEDWRTGAQAAIAGGVTTVFDMPNNNPAISTKERLEEKIAIIEKQLKEAQIPLRYHKITLSYDEKLCGFPTMSLRFPEDMPILIAIGAMAHVLTALRIHILLRKYRISQYPLSASVACSKICCAFEAVWNII